MTYNVFGGTLNPAQSNPMIQVLLKNNVIFSIMSYNLLYEYSDVAIICCCNICIALIVLSC